MTTLDQAASVREVSRWRRWANPRFVRASLAVMGLWLVQHLRRRGIAPLNVRAAARVVGRHALVMAAVYAFTLGIAMGIAQLTTR